MIKQLYAMQDLPMEDLQKIGLVNANELNISGDNISALLSGRRTEMLKLSNLSYEGHHIVELEAKLSVKPQGNGELGLLVHPIYKQAPHLSFLTIEETELLEKGKVPNIEKMIFDDDGEAKDVLIEFDQDTKEFIVTDEARILAPDRINGQYLSLDQKERYRKGKEVELEDGTKVQFSATEKQGVRSNKLAFVASMLIDGGLSFAVYHGLNYLFGEKKHNKEADVYGKGYYKDLNEVKQQKQKDEKSGQQTENKQERNFNRPGPKR